VAHYERRIVHVHRQRAADQNLPGEVTGLFQHVIESRPVYGEQQRFGLTYGFGR